ncbi:MAG TPA: metallophosphoesterase, partial [Bacteroidetes bacterium]|nr:metallophosphoesterase [Bacteroidota bacterium]
MRRVLVMVAVLLLTGSAGAGEKLEFVVGPYLQNVSQNGITVMWETN